MIMTGLFVTGCSRAEDASADPAEASQAAPVSAASSIPSAPVAPASSGSVSHARCPDEMSPVPGGRFWVGSPHGEYSREETPRFETNVAPFCMDVTEVTVEAYARCVEAGVCERAGEKKRFCNARRSHERKSHPINCVDWNQARDFCAWRRARLPSEGEWEFAARGGAENRSYSWGNESPDGRTCWKHVGGTCQVKSYAAGAFGLYDMTGNVWEWVDDWFGDYPWPPATGRTKLYRGGSWSRRFEKWMRTRLRNRFRPKQQGSHLGFRCALTLPTTTCPFGRSEDGTRCRHGVLQVDCAQAEIWNGQRCARKGEGECPARTRVVAGHGCVPEASAAGKSPKAVDGIAVSSARSPEFDADCQRYKRETPHAYRYSGGTHDERNAKSRAAGCSNRDVGAGWNSTCCP